MDYEPAESTNGLFGGNSNWRGPIWFPINFLIVEALQKFHHYFGDSFPIECPTGSGQHDDALGGVAGDFATPDVDLSSGTAKGAGRCSAASIASRHDPLWNNLIPFHEYFHGDTGAGVGASHQTGWTALVAKLLQQSGVDDESHRRVARTAQQRASRGSRHAVSV